MAGDPMPAGQPDGWLFLVTGVFMFLSMAGETTGITSPARALPSPRLGGIGTQFWGPSLLLFGADILLFPDGRLASRWWRSALRIYCVAFALLILATCVAIAGALAAHPVRVDYNGGLAAVDQPTGWFNAVQGLLALVLLGLSLAFIARQALSWRHATGERRQQLKWLASGAAVSIICLFLAANSSSSSPGNGPTLWGVLSTLAWMGVAALPIAIGVAILEYRLYDIDRIISRTLAYAILTGLLVGVYAGRSCWPPRCSNSTARSRWPPPPWSRPHCSIRPRAGCSTPWTADSTGPATTLSKW